MLKENNCLQSTPQQDKIFLSTDNCLFSRRHKFVFHSYKCFYQLHKKTQVFILETQKDKKNMCVVAIFACICQDSSSFSERVMMQSMHVSYPCLVRTCTHSRNTCTFLLGRDMRQEHYPTSFISTHKIVCTLLIQRIKHLLYGPYNFMNKGVEGF
jgi:hypothetical protein